MCQNTSWIVKKKKRKTRGKICNVLIVLLVRLTLKITQEKKPRWKFLFKGHHSISATRSYSSTTISTLLSLLLYFTRRFHRLCQSREKKTQENDKNSRLKLSVNIFFRWVIIRENKEESLFSVYSHPIEYAFFKKICWHAKMLKLFPQAVLYLYS